MDHLVPRARELVHLPPADRITERWKKLWVGQGQPQQLLFELEALMQRNGRLRPPCLLIHGDPGVGKSYTLDRFLSEYPHSREADQTGYVSMPIVKIDVPDCGHEAKFYNALLDRFDFSLKRPTSTADRQSVVFGLLRAKNVKMLVLDEFGHVALGTGSQRERFFAIIKTISNEFGIRLVAVGDDTAKTAIEFNAHLNARFDQFEFERRRLNEDFTMLLNRLARLIPLKNPSLLDDVEVRGRLFRHSKGLMSRLTMILEQAALLAIETGTEQIGLVELDVLGYD